ncbi:MAG: lycopene cyclase domain-containing protein [Gloeobacteraceae cyanobacterium ES-bin-316]|nr:lycopene cyclase domain-containing protein [Ferruginibacter sp.]
MLAASLAGPLALSFDKKVAFYKKWKFLFPAMVLPALFYIVWDSWFTSMGVWSFNPAYITGIKIYNLPVEEVLFFFVVPYCCFFIYECVLAYFPAVKNISSADPFLKILAAVLFVLGIIFYERYYTAYTFILFAVFTVLFYFFRRHFLHFKVSCFLIAYAIILIPFLLVNGFLTAIPVVLYNDAENLGLRIYTIPFEDTFYGMLLFFLNLLIYEKLKNRYQEPPLAASSKNQ